ncbi:histone-fold-containing protein, partial [Obelidium mucronatum]
ARIKKIMRSDEDVGKINAATPLLVSSALEQFLKSLVLQCVVEAKNRGGKKLMASHLKAAVNSTEKFDFLKDIVANVADPVE